MTESEYMDSRREILAGFRNKKIQSRFSLWKLSGGYRQVEQGRNTDAFGASGISRPRIEFTERRSYGCVVQPHMVAGVLPAGQQKTAQVGTDGDCNHTSLDYSRDYRRGYHESIGGQGCRSELYAGSSKGKNQEVCG